MAAVMALAWAIQRRTGQGGWADALWTFGLGAAGVGVALLPPHAAPTARQVLVGALIGLWSLRLGAHLAVRAARGGADARYEHLRATWGDQADARMFGFLMLQAAAGAVLALSILLAARRPAPGLDLQDALAALLLAGSLAGEAVADRQLAAFKADPGHGPICQRGLWAWSRHPNYFFEWLGWCAWPLFAIELSGGWPWGWLALSGPAYMLWLLTRVSGVPPLEDHMRRTRPAAFARYAARTSVFIPRPPRRGSAD
ncbi:hypothetical protein DJ017_07935 [Phenylobacterium soli]|uniref:Steroid 5-alpha reductase C-terminal domain-containing protein n=2 Tax=Phenylobacterium soli TaxID=2170551 RepID=A0A328ATL0_9CAUL|nr:hypothetical protein DJ017_07935 [Phenylobacterium soli]